MKIQPNEKPKRPMRIPMFSFWTCQRQCYWTVYRRGKDWAFDDHEGYTRIAEGNWLDLVAKFQETAANYGFRTNLC